MYVNTRLCLNVQNKFNIRYVFVEASDENIKTPIPTFEYQGEKIVVVKAGIQFQNCEISLNQFYNHTNKF